MTMDPKRAETFRSEDPLDEMRLDPEPLSEIEVESLIGHHVEFDEHDDWDIIER